MPRRLTKEINGSISIDDGNGHHVFFNNDTEFNALYPSLDLSNKPRLTYELGRSDWAFKQDPEVGINDNRPNPSGQDIEEMKVLEYESAIDNAANLLAAKNDDLRGLTLEQAKAVKRANLKQEGREVFDAKYDWLDMVVYIVDGAADKTQVKADYNSVVAAFIIARNAVNACLTIEELKILKADWPIL